MDLSEFIETSLRQILEGVRAAAAEDRAIAPGWIEGEPIYSERMVTFEVAVEIDSNVAGGLKVLSFGGVDGSVKRTAINKLTFSVPVHMNVKPK